MPIKLLCVAGARPNFMKMAPLFSVLESDPAFQPVLVHTGQHYDDKMSGQFFRELRIPPPKHHLSVGSGSHAQQTAEIMKRFEPVVLEEQPDGVVVAGDVNSTVACALVAAKLNVPVVHVEAGLRSFDRTMPEEINRIVTDTLSDVLLVTEKSGRINLLREGARPDRIYVVGNLMIDTLLKNLEKARLSGIREQAGIPPGRFGLVTLHRPSNVDDPAHLADILEALSQISQSVPLYFPVHPRTRAVIAAMALPPNCRITLLDPLGYVDFLCLMSQSAVVLTDSGGIQEETTALGVPCLTLRDNTERPITIEEGSNILAGTTRESILLAWAAAQTHPKCGRVPKYWDGHAAERCALALKSFYSSHGGSRPGV